MSKSPRLRTFDGVLRAQVAQTLATDGYTFDKKRTFRRTMLVDGHRIIQLLEFQMGIKNLVGRFTVNYGVYSADFCPPDWDNPGDVPRSCDCLPDKQHRLGQLRKPERKLSDRLLRRTPEPFDYWWPQEESFEKMELVLDEVTHLIRSGAQSILDADSRIGSLQESYDDLAKRRQGVQNKNLEHISDSANAV